MDAFLKFAGVDGTVAFVATVDGDVDGVLFNFVFEVIVFAQVCFFKPQVHDV